MNLPPAFPTSTVPADDMRVDYLEEARDCLRASNSILKRYPKSWQDIPAFWANLLGAIANSNIAAVNNDVAMGFHSREEERRRRGARIRDMLDEKLGCPTTE